MDIQHQILDRLDALRVELVEQAFALDRAGNLPAADVVMMTSARVAELRQEFFDEPAPLTTERASTLSLCPP